MFASHTDALLVDHFEQQRLRTRIPNFTTSNAQTTYQIVAPPPGVPVVPKSNGFQPAVYPDIQQPYPSGVPFMGGLQTAQQAYGSGAFQHGGSFSHSPHTPRPVPNGPSTPMMACSLLLNEPQPTRQPFVQTPPEERLKKTRFQAHPRDNESSSHIPRGNPHTDDPILRTIIEQSQSRKRFNDTKSAGPF
jgi:hypothetical protein